MELLQHIIGSIPRTVVVLVILTIVSVFVLRTLRVPRKSMIEIDEAVFKARPSLLFFFIVLCGVFMWPVVMGLGGSSSSIDAGLDVFLLLNVLPRLIFFGLSAFFGIGVFILKRSYVRITSEAVEYCDGWHKPRRILRNEIVSVRGQHPGAILVVQCRTKENSFTLPLLAYSRAGLLVALLQPSAMRI